MMHRGYGWFGGMGFLGIIIAIVVIYLLIQYFSENKRNRYTDEEGTHKPMDSNREALDILDERYAKGEIDEEEYKQRKKVLKD